MSNKFYTPQTVPRAKINKTLFLPLSERAVRQIITNSMVSAMTLLCLCAITLRHHLSQSGHF